MAQDRKLAQEMNKFADELKRKGYGTEVSVIVVAGDYKSKNILCKQIIPSNFLGVTVDTLDGLLASIKVQGMKGKAQMSTEIMVKNRHNGETEYISIDDTEKLKEMVSTEVIDSLKEHYENMVETIGEKEAKRQILTGIVGNVMSNHDEWKQADNDKKLSLIAEFIMEIKEHEGTEWLPDDYDDGEILKVIREVEHIENFGYAPKFDENDVSYG